MIVIAALLSAAAVLAAVPGSARTARVRLLHLVPPPRVPRAGSSVLARLSPAGRRWAAAVFAGCCCAVVVGGMAGPALGVFAAVGCEAWLRRLEPRSLRRRRERLAADLPVAADLLAGCLLAGSTLDDAAESVAVAVGGPLEGALHGVVASVRLGADPPAAWLSLAEEPCLEPLARTVARAVSSGAPMAEAMARLADDQRGLRRRHAAAAARRVGVRAALPLGLCFLPAFVLLGVLPVIGEIAGSVLGE